MPKNIKRVKEGSNTRRKTISLQRLEFGESFLFIISFVQMAKKKYKKRENLARRSQNSFSYYLINSVAVLFFHMATERVSKCLQLFNCRSYLLYFTSLFNVENYLFLFTYCLSLIRQIYFQISFFLVIEQMRKMCRRKVH